MRQVLWGVVDTVPGDRAAGAQELWQPVGLEAAGLFSLAVSRGDSRG